MTDLPASTAAAPSTAQRATRQRAAVADLLDRVDEFRSAQSLHDQLRKEGADVGLTTVYRHLQALANAGEVDVLRAGDGEAVYRRCATVEHHHHLVCRHCGRAVEIDGPEVEAWLTALAARHGFGEVTHSIEVFGTCSSCSAGTT